MSKVQEQINNFLTNKPFNIEQYVPKLDQYDVKLDVNNIITVSYQYVYDNFTKNMLIKLLDLLIVCIDYFDKFDENISNIYYDVILCNIIIRNTNWLTKPFIEMVNRKQINNKSNKHLLLDKLIADVLNEEYINSYNILKDQIGYGQNSDINTDELLTLGKSFLQSSKSKKDYQVNLNNYTADLESIKNVHTMQIDSKSAADILLEIEELV